MTSTTVGREHQTVPLSVLLKRELASEKIERPEISHGQAGQSKKGEDFSLLKTGCERVVGDGLTTYSVYGNPLIPPTQGGQDGNGSYLVSRESVVPPLPQRKWNNFSPGFHGHNGTATAIYTKENLLSNVVSAILPDLNQDEWIAALPRALVAGFVKTDKDFQTKAQRSGTTVTFVIIEGWVVTIASVGDSQCVLESTEGDIYYLSADHRLECNEEERDRITASGGKIGPLRCWPGGLCLSRSIGDVDVGEFIVPVPYVKQVKLSTAGGRLVIVSDGVWDALSAEASLDISRSLSSEAAASQIVKEAVKYKGLRDDTTYIVVDILPPEKPAAPLPPPRKPVKGVLKSMFWKKTSESSSQIDVEYIQPDIVEELFEEGSAMLSERFLTQGVFCKLDTKYPICNMFKLFVCAVCQVEIKPEEGISIHVDASHSRKLRPWDGPFLCISCQEKKEAMEGKRPSGDQHNSDSD